ncbi:hypothetical protein [Catenuloplanes japonicus]|uniref:hypothetical protein n=1 Tax=Catenuloplanes japonicus TaxID=33876 RepID=UPI0012F98263|nr:hypothetical protein [Catenuloplanes japonicus]
MVYGQGRQRVMADDPAELLSHLIPGYLDFPPELRPALRVSHAEEALHRLQQRINVAYGLDDVDSDEWRLLTTEHGGQVVIDAWSASVPLVLVDAHYAPYTEQPRPEERGGRIVWLDTTDDETYLNSVALAGEVFLAVRADDEPEPGETPEPASAAPVTPAQAAPVAPASPATPQWSMPFSTASSGPAEDVP